MDNQQAPRRLFFGGEPKHLFSVDCHTWDIVREMPTSSLTTAIKRCRSQLALGTGSGMVVLREAITLNEILRIPAFKGVVMDLASRDTYIAATGTHNFGMSDNLKIFDIRKPTEAAVKVHFKFPPRYVARHPLDASYVIVASKDGIYSINLSQGIIEDSKSFKFPDGPLGHDVTSITVSPTAEVIAVGDSSGRTHVWNTTTSALINPGSSLFDTVPHPYVKAGLQRVPQNEIADFMANLSYSTTGEYSSDWPPESYIILQNAPPREIDPKLIPVLPSKTTIMPNPGISHVAQAYVPQESTPNPYPFNDQIGPDLRPHAIATQLRYLRNPMQTKALESCDLGIFGNVEFDNERAYHEHHDWDAINACPSVTGLENTLPDAWMNSLVQAFYHVFAPQWPMRRAIMNHWCRRRYCCSCEMAVVFHNMAMHSSASCGPRILSIAHFFRALRNLDAFNAANLFRASLSQEDAIQMMHDLLFTMIHTMHSELTVHETVRYSGGINQGETIAEWFGVQWEQNSTKRPKFVWNVPPVCKSVEEGLQKAFSEHADIQNLPPIVAITLNKGPREETLEPPDLLTFTKHKGAPTTYVLMCKIVLVYDEHFVCLARTSSEKDSWCDINDHIVMPITPERALYTHDVGVPVVAFYCCDNYVPKRRNDIKVFALNSVMRMLDVDDTPKREKWLSVVWHQSKAQSTVINRNLSTSGFEGALVAIDAEYVVLDWGRLRCARPPMSLARVSCVLGTTQECFLDDYIAVSEPVQDYVTRYSGIHPGDLSIETSSKSLTTLKACWTKLKVLVSAGVRFIGHGLAQDMRVMHLVIPSTQILDTVEIYRIPSQRKISLKFLMWYVFNEAVQMHEHDSIEDARCALRLYLKYEELQKQGKFDAFIQELYQKGNETNWLIQPVN
jgi:PAB-dependent poly(A)-specific ribonuclease subunit 2